MFALFFFAILSSSHFSAALEGTIISLRRFNGNLVVQQYPVPAAATGLVQQNHLLDGDLSEFSLTCSSCEGPTVLAFERGPVSLHVVLNDGSLSVLETDVTQSADSKPTQVVQLDTECDPVHLLAFRYSPDHFAIVCTGLNVHLAEITSNREVKVHQLSVGSDLPGVLVESQKQLFSITYLGQSAYEKYSYHSATLEVLSLPDNVRCLEDNTVTLHPLNGREEFLLQCVTPDGPTLYIVPLTLGEMARALESHGKPHSSLDGTYVSMLNGSRVVSYPTANQSELASSEVFPSRVVKFEFLSPQNALVLTEGGEHYVMDLGYGRLEKRLFPGGLPVKWAWVSPSNHYLYVTANNELYLINETSTKPEYTLKSIVGQPELLLFLKKYTQPPPTTQPPTAKDVTVDPPSPGFINEDPPQETPLPAILGGVFGGIVLLAGAVLLVAGLIVGAKIRRQRRRRRNPRYKAVQETEPPTTLATPLCDRTGPTPATGGPAVGERLEDEKQETTFTQPPAAVPPDPIHSSEGAHATTASTEPLKGRSEDRDVQHVATSKQVVSPARIPNVPIQPGVNSKNPIAAPSKQTVSTLEMVPNVSGISSKTSEAKNPSPPPPAPAVPYAKKSPPILPFHGQESLSCAGEPRTASSVFTQAVDETCPPHSDLPSK